MVKGIDYPEWMTEESITTLKGGYLVNNETVKDMWWRVVNSAGSYLEKMDTDKHFNIEEIKQRWFDYLWKGWLCLATPVAANSGTNRGLTISCFGVRLADTTQSIFEKLTEAALLSKHGGGLGIGFDKVRGRGEVISKGGFSEGTIPFMKVYDSMIHSVSQGGVRRGAMAIYLPARHKDFDEFLHISEPKGDVNRQCLNIFPAVSFDNIFMEKVMERDGYYTDKWAKYLSARMKTGKPYAMFYDNANDANPECYKKRGMKVNHSQLCLHGDTLVATKEYGDIAIKNLVGKEVTIFDGNEWVKNSNFRKTQENAEFYKIVFENGLTVLATPNHKWAIIPNALAYLVTTENLVEGDRVKSYSYIDKNDNFIRQNMTTIVSIEKLPLSTFTGDAYCTTVPTTNMFGLAKGILTGNCNEIMLYSDEKHSYVCCLSSLNIVNFDEWEDDKNFIADAVLFLDCVMEEFIQKASKIDGFECAVRFAKKSRALGLGVLGWHTYLQSKEIPFISLASRAIANKIAQKIKMETLTASQNLGEKLGIPEWCDDTRHTHLTAIAPTTSNSLISGGVSQGIEPIVSNYFNQKSAKGTFIRKNNFFEELITKHYSHYNTEEMWNSIRDAKGSVQHLTFLSDDEREIYLTAYEINQLELVRLAAIWQKGIDQGISLNLFFPADVDKKWLNKVHIEAWQLKLKGLYYLRSESIASRDMKTDTFSDCVFCEG